MFHAAGFSESQEHPVTGCVGLENDCIIIITNRLMNKGFMKCQSYPILVDLKLINFASEFTIYLQGRT